MHIGPIFKLSSVISPYQFSYVPMYYIVKSMTTVCIFANYILTLFVVGVILQVSQAGEGDEIQAAP